MAKPSEVRRPEGFDLHPLVVCVNGPRAGAWYFEDFGSTSWTWQMRQALLDKSPGSSITGYVDSGKTVPHPRWPDVRGKALTWNGGTGGSNP